MRSRSRSNYRRSFIHKFFAVVLPGRDETRALLAAVFARYANVICHRDCARLGVPSGAHWSPEVRGGSSIFVCSNNSLKYLADKIYIGLRNRHRLRSSSSHWHWLIPKGARVSAA